MNKENNISNENKYIKNIFNNSSHNICGSRGFILMGTAGIS